MSTVKCPVCGKENDKNDKSIVPYKRKYYCEDCFVEKFEPDEVDKHFFYLNFKEIIGREPMAVEWTQCNKLIKDSGWNWKKLDYAMYYVYILENMQPSNDTGVIGILPYYEAKMMKFRNECFDVMDDIDEFGFGMAEEETVIIKPRKENYEHKIKHIDIDWSDEDCQDE